MPHHDCSDHSDWHLARRLRAKREWLLAGGHGAGQRGWGRGRGRGSDGGSFRVGKMLADGDLRLIVLGLLAESPRHGYDIIKALEERSSGIYSPSPGVVYPTLTYLEEAGYATAAAEGNKRVFTITDAGRTHLDDNREAADAELAEMERLGRKLARARAWTDWAEGGTDQPQLAELDRARRRLRLLIADAIEGNEDDQRRLAEILNRAADEALERSRGGSPM